MLIDYVAELVHERRHLLADRGPYLIDHDQPDIQVRIPVSDTAAD